MKHTWAAQVMDGETRDVIGELVAEFEEKEQAKITDFSCALDILALDDESFNDFIVQPPTLRPDPAGEPDPDAPTAEVGGRIFTFHAAPSDDDEEDE
jgi:hypothetical protein